LTAVINYSSNIHAMFRRKESNSIL